MIVINYMKDGERYRLWLSNWPGDNFVMCTCDEFNAINKINSVFTLVDREDDFMSAGGAK
jgi:hypothetical protein